MHAELEVIGQSTVYVEFLFICLSILDCLQRWKLSLLELTFSPSLQERNAMGFFLQALWSYFHSTDNTVQLLALRSSATPLTLENPCTGLWRHFELR